MSTVLIYLKSRKKPFEISFESEKSLKKFYDSLSNDFIQVGPLSFFKEEFAYCIEK